MIGLSSAKANPGAKAAYSGARYGGSTIAASSLGSALCNTELAA